MIENNDTKFPESFRASEDNSGINISDVFEFEEVMVWFKRCNEDFPYPTISRYPTPEKVADELLGYAVAVKNWHTRWFSQFRGKCQK